MLEEVVPWNEKSKALLKLMTWKMGTGLDKHIDTFNELFEICETPRAEAYISFFMSVSQHLKGKLAEKNTGSKN